MISNTLKEFIGQAITVKVTNAYNALGGILEKVEDDHIVLRNSGEYLKKYGDGRLVISTSQIVNVICVSKPPPPEKSYELWLSDEERNKDGKNNDNTERRQKLVNVHK